MSTQEIDSVLWEYLSCNNIVVLDSVASGRMALISQLTKLGAVSARISSVGTIEDAQAEALRNHAKIIFSDFNIGSRSGLELLQNLKVEYDKQNIKDYLFVLVTSDASQSAVARAAEEDVDTFVIKPYSFDTLHKSLAKAIRAKLMPSRYMQLIDEGKEFLFRKELDVALECFKEAMTESPEPTLACFYMGQTQYLQACLESSEKDYLKGLFYNRIHYKCMVGLYDLFLSQKKFDEAYDIVRRIAQFFPANPTRLASVLRLAITTNNFQDIEEYYRIFVKLEQRSDELVKCICSALVVAGKYYLTQRSPKRALELFQFAAVSAAGNAGVLLYIVEALSAYQYLDEARPFKERIRRVAMGSMEDQVSEYHLIFPTIPIAERIVASRKMIELGFHRLIIYENLAGDLMASGQVSEYEKVMEVAFQKWPEEKTRLNAFADQQKRWVG
jgi:CheY-like chemotaxis protein